jgi:hypothetical protein
VCTEAVIIMRAVGKALTWCGAIGRPPVGVVPPAARVPGKLAYAWPDAGDTLART